MAWWNSSSCPKLIGALLLVGGCVSQSSGESHELSDAAQLETGKPVACAPATAQAIALLDSSDAARPCGLTLELDGANMLVRPRARLDAESGWLAAELDAIARGPWPEDCGEGARLCEFTGTHDRLGPVVLASVRGPESELPTQIHVGWVAGEQLVFVETWYGPPSVGDHTRLGPVWALAPFDCDGELLLLPAPRLPEAVNEQPSEILRALSGAWPVTGGVAEPPPSPASVESSSCRALIHPIP